METRMDRLEYKRLKKAMDLEIVVAISLVVAGLIVSTFGN